MHDSVVFLINVCSSMLYFHAVINKITQHVVCNIINKIFLKTSI